MCGIAGIVMFDHQAPDPSAIRRMTKAMAHRGPDAEGFFEQEGLAFGHLRLSIIDLSDAANQPFHDNSGRYTIVFNGEIYNYRQVKALIGDYDFHTTSDTEVIIAAYAKWGAACLEHFRGMFALAIWDSREKQLFIARDRLGVKPLYYYHDDHRLIFASEVRGILATGLVPRKMDSLALQEYFHYQSVSFPFSPIEGIRQLEAGSWMTIAGSRIEKARYWDLTAAPPAFDFSDITATHKRIRELMLQSVARRLVSDVPVGAFLSGGIDSSAVVGLMAEAGTSKPNTFTVGFEEKEYDESPYAAMIAKKFDTCHTRIVLKPDTFLDEMQHALDAMDTPSLDGVNTYVVSKAITRNGMRVALSGAGGDELFAGYPFFQQYLDLRRRQGLWAIPAPLRRGLASLIAIGQRQGRRNRLAQLLSMPSPTIDEAYPVFRQLLSPATVRRLASLAGNGSVTTAVQSELSARRREIDQLPLLSQVSAAEYLGYTQHTLLKDTDQMSMAMSLEVREPFFDHDLIEFVLAIPDRLKRPVYPKSLLVESLKPMLPDEIVFRKKQGFVIPYAVWMKNQLRSFCDEKIRRLAARPGFSAPHLTALWTDFLQGKPGIRWADVWIFVVLENWLEKNGVQ